MSSILDNMESKGEEGILVEGGGVVVGERKTSGELEDEIMKKAASAAAEEEKSAHEIVGSTDDNAGSAAAAATLQEEDDEPLEKGQLSPLTGSYLLIVIAEPYSEADRERIIQRLTKGLLTWDRDLSHVDLNCELLNLANAAPDGDEVKNGEKLVQWASENLVVEVLIHSQVNTLFQCMKNLLASFTRHRHIIHAGYTFSGNGSWILQDGTFSLNDFVELWDEPDVSRLLSAYKGDISLTLHCAENGWTEERLHKESFSKLCQVYLNPSPNDKLSSVHNAGIMSFIEYISKMILPSPLDEILQPSDIVGNIRFSHPTLYVFPGGQGDAALFGVNGFNMLIDGGFSRKACFWNFVRHLDRLDAVLLTRINHNSIGGLGALLDRKKISQVFPQIGHFFGNVIETCSGGKGSSRSSEADIEKGEKELLLKKDESETPFVTTGDLMISLTSIGQNMLQNLHGLSLKPQFCLRENHLDPINLYHKVGHGKLDLYILNPAKDSRELKEFLSKWNNESIATKMLSKRTDYRGRETISFPVLNLVSICALVVWQPTDPREHITRLLFPGSTPQGKIFEALGKLKHLEFLKFPVCSAKTIAASHKIKGKTEKLITEVKSQLSSKSNSSQVLSSGKPPAQSTAPAKPIPSPKISLPKATKAGQNREKQLLASVEPETKLNNSSATNLIGNEGLATEEVQKEESDKIEKKEKPRRGRSETRRIPVKKITSSSTDNRKIEKEAATESKKVSKRQVVKSTEDSTTAASSTTTAETSLTKTSTTAAAPARKKVERPRTAVPKKEATTNGHKVSPTSPKKAPESDVAVPESEVGEKVASPEPLIIKQAPLATKPKVESKYGISKSMSKSSASSATVAPPKPLAETETKKIVQQKKVPVRALPQPISKTVPPPKKPEPKPKATKPSAASNTAKPPTKSSTAPKPVSRKIVGGAAAAVAVASSAAVATALVEAEGSVEKPDEIKTNGTAKSPTPEPEQGPGLLEDSASEINKAETNLFEASSATATEPSSELSSLEHVSANEDENIPSSPKAETDRNATPTMSPYAFTDTEDSTATPQAERHLGVHRYDDDEEDEYLVVEKSTDESASVEQLVATTNGHGSFETRHSVIEKSHNKDDIDSLMIKDAVDSPRDVQVKEEQEKFKDEKIESLPKDTIDIENKELPQQDQQTHDVEKFDMVEQTSKSEPVFEPQSDENIKNEEALSFDSHASHELLTETATTTKTDADATKEESMKTDKLEQLETKQPSTKSDDSSLQQNIMEADHQSSSGQQDYSEPINEIENKMSIKEPVQSFGLSSSVVEVSDSHETVGEMISPQHDEVVSLMDSSKMAEVIAKTSTTPLEAEIDIGRPNDGLYGKTIPELLPKDEESLSPSGVITTEKMTIIEPQEKIKQELLLKDKDDEDHENDYFKVESKLDTKNDTFPSPSVKEISSTGNEKDMFSTLHSAVEPIEVEVLRSESGVSFTGGSSSVEEGHHGDSSDEYGGFDTKIDQNILEPQSKFEFIKDAEETVTQKKNEIESVDFHATSISAAGSKTSTPHLGASEQKNETAFKLTSKDAEVSSSGDFDEQEQLPGVDSSTNFEKITPQQKPQEKQQPVKEQEKDVKEVEVKQYPIQYGQDKSLESKIELHEESQIEPEEDINNFPTRKQSTSASEFASSHQSQPDKEEEKKEKIRLEGKEEEIKFEGKEKEEEKKDPSKEKPDKDDIFPEKVSITPSPKQDKDQSSYLDNKVPDEKKETSLDAKKEAEDIKEREKISEETTPLLKQQIESEIPFTRPPAGISSVIREVIRTPDEVAELPVHEEVEAGSYKIDEFHPHRHEHEFSDDEDLGIDAIPIMKPVLPEIQEQTTSSLTSGSFQEKADVENMEKEKLGEASNKKTPELDQYSDDEEKNEQTKEDKTKEATAPTTGQTKIDEISSDMTKAIEKIDAAIVSVFESETLDALRKDERDEYDLGFDHQSTSAKQVETEAEYHRKDASSFKPSLLMASMSEPISTNGTSVVITPSTPPVRFEDDGYTTKKQQFQLPEQENKNYDKENKDTSSSQPEFSGDEKKILEEQFDLQGPNKSAINQKEEKEHDFQHSKEAEKLGHVDEQKDELERKEIEPEAIDSFSSFNATVKKDESKEIIDPNNLKSSAPSSSFPANRATTTTSESSLLVEGDHEKGERKISSDDSTASSTSMKTTIISQQQSPTSDNNSTSKTPDLDSSVASVINTNTNQSASAITEPNSEEEKAKFYVGGGSHEEDEEECFYVVETPGSDRGAGQFATKIVTRDDFEEYNDEEELDYEIKGREDAIKSGLIAAATTASATLISHSPEHWTSATSPFVQDPEIDEGNYDDDRLSPDSIVNEPMCVKTEQEMDKKYFGGVAFEKKLEPEPVVEKPLATSYVFQTGAVADESAFGENFKSSSHSEIEQKDKSDPEIAYKLEIIPNIKSESQDSLNDEKPFSAPAVTKDVAENEKQKDESNKLFKEPPTSVTAAGQESQQHNLDDQPKIGTSASHFPSSFSVPDPGNNSCANKDIEEVELAASAEPSISPLSLSPQPKDLSKINNAVGEAPATKPASSSAETLPSSSFIQPSSNKESHKSQDGLDSDSDNELRNTAEDKTGGNIYEGDEDEEEDYDFTGGTASGSVLEKLAQAEYKAVSSKGVGNMEKVKSENAENEGLQGFTSKTLTDSDRQTQDVISKLLAEQAAEDDSWTKMETIEASDEEEQFGNYGDQVHSTDGESKPLTTVEVEETIEKMDDGKSQIKTTITTTTIEHPVETKTFYTIVDDPKKLDQYELISSKDTFSNTGGQSTDEQKPKTMVDESKTIEKSDDGKSQIERTITTTTIEHPPTYTIIDDPKQIEEYEKLLNKGASTSDEQPKTTVEESKIIETAEDGTKIERTIIKTTIEHPTIYSVVDDPKKIEEYEKLINQTGSPISMTSYPVIKEVAGSASTFGQSSQIGSSTVPTTTINYPIEISSIYSAKEERYSDSEEEEAKITKDSTTKEFVDKSSFGKDESTAPFPSTIKLADSDFTKISTTKDESSSFTAMAKETSSESAKSMLLKNETALSSTTAKESVNDFKLSTDESHSSDFQTLKDHSGILTSISKESAFGIKSSISKEESATLSSTIFKESTLGDSKFVNVKGKEPVKESSEEYSRSTSVSNAESEDKSKKTTTSTFGPTGTTSDVFEESSKTFSSNPFQEHVYVSSGTRSGPFDQQVFDTSPPIRRFSVQDDTHDLGDEHQKLQRRASEMASSKMTTSPPFSAPQNPFSSMVSNNPIQETQPASISSASVYSSGHEYETMKVGAGDTEIQQPLSFQPKMFEEAQGGHYFPQQVSQDMDEETNSSGDFSDSQLSTIPQQHMYPDLHEIQHQQHFRGERQGHMFDSDNEEEEYLEGGYDDPNIVTPTSNTNLTIIPPNDSTNNKRNDLENGNANNSNDIFNNGNKLETSLSKGTTSSSASTSSSSTSSAATIGSATTKTQIGGASANVVAMASDDDDDEDIVKKWGKPLGLPVIHPEDESGPTMTEKRERGSSATPKKTPTSSQQKKRSSSSRAAHSSTKNLPPIYVDLAYVPHHGNSNYSDSEFFRLVRSRYYVFSGLEPSRQVFEGLLRGKKAWEDKNLDVTIIPTYDTDSLAYWVIDSEEALHEAHIDLAPSASRCTINLQDHDTSCAAYRLEF